MNREHGFWVLVWFMTLMPLTQYISQLYPYRLTPPRPEGERIEDTPWYNTVLAVLFFIGARLTVNLYKDTRRRTRSVPEVFTR